MKKWWKLGTKGVVAGAFIAGAAIIATPVVVSAANNVATSTINNASVTNDESTYTYVPVTIDGGYNCPTIIADSDVSKVAGMNNVSMVDYPSTKTIQQLIDEGALSSNTKSAIMLTSAARNATVGTGQANAVGFDDPEDGYITVESQNDNTQGLYWKIPVVNSTTSETPINNTLKLFNQGSDDAEGSFSFYDLGVYKELYALCLVSNVPTETKSNPVEIQVGVTYAGDTEPTWQETKYNVYDWMKEQGTSLSTFATSKYTRCLMKYTDNVLSSAKWDDGNESKYVVFNQCPIDPDPARKGKTIEKINIKLVGQSQSSNEDIITLTVFGISGKVLNDIVKPVSIKTHKTKDETTGEYRNYVTWAKSTEGTEPYCYYLDIWYEEDGKVIWTKYNSEQILATSEIGKAMKIDVTDALTETDKVYYVQMRAGNAAGEQSANSNIDYIYTDKGVPITITCEVQSSNANDTGKEFDISVDHPAKVKTVVYSDQGVGELCGDQGVNWKIPDAYKDIVPTPTDVTPQGESGYKIWSVNVTKPVKLSSALVACAHANIVQTDEITGSAKPNPVTPTIPEATIGDVKATVQWENPDIGTSEESENTFSIEVYPSPANANDTPVFTKTGIPYDSSGTTSCEVTGLTPKKSYVAKVKTDYKASESNANDSEVISSEVTTSDPFTTIVNEAATLEIDKTDIVLTLGYTNTTADVTTKVYGSDSEYATYQDVEWTGPQGFVEIKQSEVQYKTPIVNTFNPLKANLSAQPYVATVKNATSTISKTVNVSFKVAATSTESASNITPVSFNANWVPAKRADDSYWATGYIVKLYDSTDVEITSARQTITDPQVSTCTFDGLSHVSDYKYTVTTVNNGVESTESAKVPVTTAELSDYEIKVIGDGIETILGETISRETEVVGYHNGIAYKSAGEQKVNAVDSNNVFQISGGESTTHLFKALKEGSTKITLTGTDEKFKTITTEVDGKVLSMSELKLEQTSKNSFKANWNDLSSYASVKANFYYSYIVATDKEFKNVVLEKTTTNSSFDLKDLASNKTYYVKVKYVNQSVSSSYVTGEIYIGNQLKPWMIALISIGSATGGWLLISYILYIFWKKSWLKTYDQKKVKDKVKGEKVKTHDKYFRIIDKACVTTNAKVAKRSNSLMTRFGTENEQKEKYGK